MFHKLVAAAPIGMIIVDDRGVISIANGHSKEIFGYEPDELVGKDIELLIPVELRSHHIKDRNRYLKQPQNRPINGRQDLRAVHKDGHEFPVEIGLTPFFSGEKNFVLASIVDNSQHKETEKALKESAEQYRILAESSQDAIFLINRDFTIGYVNTQAARWFGEKPEDLVGKSLTEVFPRDVNDRQLRSLRKVFEEGNPYHSPNLPFGIDQQRWLNTVLSPIKDEKGVVLSVLGVARDVTQQVDVEHQLERRVNELEALYESGQAFNQSLQTQEICNQIIRLLEKRMKWHHAAVRLVKQGSEEIELLAFSEHLQEDIENTSHRMNSVLKIGEGLSGWVIQHGQPVLTDQLQDDDRYYETFPGMNSGLYVPILAAGTTIGCINVETNRRSAFNENDLRFLTTIASQAGIAIENSRLYEAAIKAATRSEALYQAGQEMALISDDANQIYKAAHIAVAKLLPAEVFVISLLTDDPSELEAVYLFDDNQIFPARKIPLEGSISGQVINEGRTIYYPDIEESDFKGIRFGSERPVRSLMGVPLRVGGSVIGVMLIETYQPQAYSPDDKLMLESLAAQTAISIENTRLFYDIKRNSEEQTILYETIRDISLQWDLESQLRIVADRAKSLLNADAGSVFLYDSSNNSLEIVANSQPEYIGLRIEIGVGFTGRIAETRTPLIVQDYRTWEFNSQKYLNINTRAMLGTPLLYQGEFLGVLAVAELDKEAESDSRLRQFTERDSHLLELLANAAAGPIYSSRLLEATQAHAAEFKNLYEITRDVTTSSQNLDTLLEKLTNRAVKILNAARGGIYLYEPQTQTLELRYTYAYENMQGIRLKLGEGVAGKVAENRESLILDNYLAWDGHSPQFDTQDVGAVLEVPMLFGQELIGVLVVDEKSDSKRKYNHEDARLLSLIASATAGTVFSTRLLEQTRTRADEFKNLYEITKEITTSGLNLDVLLENICGKAAQLLHAKRGGIYLFDPQTNSLELSYTLGFEAQVGVKLALGEGMAGRVALTREPLIVDNYSVWDGRSPKLDNQDFGAVLEVPMIIGQELIGVLVINETADSPRKFTQEDSRILSLVASATAGLVYNTRLLEQSKIHGHQMESVNSLGRAMAESLDLQEIFDRLRQSAMELVLDIDKIFISLYDPETSVLQTVYAVEHGKSGEAVNSAVRSNSSPPNEFFKQVIQTGRSVREDFPDNTASANHSAAIDQDSGQPMHSAIHVPMLAEGIVIGVMQLVSYIKSSFTKTDEDLLTIAANTAAVAIQNSNLVKKLRQRVDQLSSLHAIDTAISSTTDLRMSLQTILGNVTRLLNVDAADIQLLNQTTLMLETVASRGFRTNEISHTSLRIGEGRLGQAVLNRKMVITDNRRELLSDPTRRSLAELEDFHAQVAAPLIAKGQVRGVLEIFNRSSINPNRDWLDFLDVLSAQASLAIDSGQMFENLGRANMELTLAYDATIEGWSQAMDLRDKETEGHTRRVTELAIELARKLDLSPTLLVQMRRGALLHDIGKMGIPDRILLKSDKLTEDEWAIMKQHPSHAELLLSRIDYLRPAMEIPAYHHEKWDGSGYPNGLKGEQIPLSARIFAVVDVYDALTSDRPYRLAWTKEKALDYIREESGKHFDPNIANIFLKMIEKI